MWKGSGAVGVLLIGWLCASCREGDIPELTIERPHQRAITPGANTNPLLHWEDLGDGLYQSQFRLPPGFRFEGGAAGESGNADPFADPPQGIYRRKISAQEALEEVGIKFGEKSSIVFNEKTRLLTVKNTQPQLSLVEAYFDSLMFHGPSGIIMTRVEIFKVPDRYARQVLNSSGREGEHSPEREALLDAVDSGRAKLIASPSALCRSGQRTLLKDVQSGAPSSVGESHDREEPALAEGRLIASGLLLEIDPVLGADEYTMDFQIGLTFFEKFREKSIETVATVLDGDHLLLGVWDSDSKNSRLVVFLTATVQKVGGFEQLIEAESNPSGE